MRAPVFLCFPGSFAADSNIHAVAVLQGGNLHTEEGGHSRAKSNHSPTELKNVPSSQLKGEITGKP